MLEEELGQSAPNAAHYAISFEAARSLTGWLTFRFPGGRAHHEAFILLPTGVFFRGKLLPSVEHMLSAFKRVSAARV